MNIVESFSLSTGLRIDRPDLYDATYPLPFTEPYIVLVTSTGVPSKNFPHWQWVLTLIRPALVKLGYKCVQIGGEKDEPVEADVDLRGKTNISQMFGLIKNSRCVLAGDTSAIHVAGAFNVPFVSVFSISHPDTSGAYFGDKQKQRYVLPPYRDGRPSYHPGEMPPVVASVKPESVANEFLTMFGQESVPFKTLHAGEHYKNITLISIPETLVPAQFLSHGALNIRYDLGGSEEIVCQQVATRPSQIVTNKPLDVKQLDRVRRNLLRVVYLIDSSHSPEFVMQLHRAGLPYQLASLESQEFIDALKHLYFDFGVIERKVLCDKAPVKVNDNTRFLTKKFVISGDKLYLSRAHLAQKKSIDSPIKNSDYIINDPLFWEDVQFAYLYET